MSKLLGVRLNRSRQEKLIFLYKLYHIESKTETNRFRKLLDAIYSEKQNSSESPTLSTTQHPDLELLEGWDCVYRVLIYPHNRISKKKEPKIFCLNPTTREILRTNELYIPICRKCHDTNGSIRYELPEPKKPKKITSKTQPKPVPKQRRCVDCGADISYLSEEWKTRCPSCYWKSKSSVWQGEGKPLRGSPADLRKREADRFRRK